MSEETSATSEFEQEPRMLAVDRKTLVERMRAKEQPEKMTEEQKVWLREMEEKMRAISEHEQKIAKGQPEEETDLAEVLIDLSHRLDRLEQHFSEQGINDLAHAIELRIVSRLKYGRNPWIEKHV